MNNCGISFGNILKNVASGDTFTFHYSLFTFPSPHRRGRRPRRPASLPPWGKVAKIFDFCRMRSSAKQKFGFLTVASQPTPHQSACPADSFPSRGSLFLLSQLTDKRELAYPPYVPGQFPNPVVRPCPPFSRWHRRSSRSSRGPLRPSSPRFPGCFPAP